jgi:hypothetical protein
MRTFDVSEPRRVDHPLDLLIENLPVQSSSRHPSSDLLLLSREAVAESRPRKRAARSRRWPPARLGVTTSGRTHRARRMRWPISEPPLERSSGLAGGLCNSLTRKRKRSLATARSDCQHGDSGYGLPDQGRHTSDRQVGASQAEHKHGDAASVPSCPVVDTGQCPPRDTRTK